MNPAGHRGCAARPVALFVLGVPRSGTSAVTRVLSLCGATLPAGLSGADPRNPRGYWEPRASLHLNNTILRRHGSAVFDSSLRLQEEGGIDADQKAVCINKIGQFLATLPAAPLVLIKDLQITLLSSMWFEAARLAGFDIAVVNMVRPPQEVIASGAADFLTSPELGSALWLKFNLLAERDTRELPRVFVEYANLLEDWRREVKRISVALGIDLDSRDEGVIDEFLTPDLHRQRHTGPVTETFGTDWISAVYEALSAAALDEPLDQSALDRVYAEYRASEQGFRTVFENSLRLNKLNRFIRPSILKFRYEAVALAHRRRGTWA
ncbi:MULTISPECIES: sulfotransferase family protein [unclassified Mycolicibacterium]|uniref:sulfotransferase family protein n=1 Tax=unclassified Mycolicibacterium TaxID=2636767 RepID=UPI001305BFFB|nr:MULTISPECIES: sulfotransferase family protein [unclassified Mycolicibacterium]MUL84652.1 sulfotransferase family protein [Mycolicibacterium sp. CBMA 329]MUL88427.1 sulfotransferase family protein [Mycolicibacterium sp. CBMA 331]MUM03036.1 sulfotransferase family protein [Mycolicibacterium sp. CBMA 334]MUM40074.1 sulfotransferase family protein [Mycolicibacterium sp. CBMA 247]MUM44492.1 sulfotransferase family protein [Mycolicibacterium sp. CBMA 294]